MTARSYQSPGEAVSAFFLPLLGLFNFSQLPVSVDRTSHAGCWSQMIVPPSIWCICRCFVLQPGLWLWLSPFLLFLCSWFTEPEGAGAPSTVRRIHVLKSVAALISFSRPLFSCLGGFYLWLTFMNPYHDSHCPLRFPATYSCLVFVLFCLSRILFLNSPRKLSSALSAHWRKRYLLAKMAMS